VANTAGDPPASELKLLATSTATTRPNGISPSRYRDLRPLNRRRPVGRRRTSLPPTPVRPDDRVEELVTLINVADEGPTTHQRPMARNQGGAHLTRRVLQLRHSMDASAEASARTSLSRAVLPRQASGRTGSSPALRRVLEDPSNTSVERQRTAAAAVRSGPTAKAVEATAPARSRFSSVDLCVGEALRKSSKATVDVVRSTRMASPFTDPCAIRRSAKKQKLLEETVEHLVGDGFGPGVGKSGSPGDPAHQQCIARRAGMAGANTWGTTTPARSARRVR